jgi:transcriptional regulator with PAS, ATPase and Fis domain
VARTPATVLLLGETGVGKDVFAQALHELSPRGHRQMIRVSCAAIPSALIESELFGRERGAFTGALTRQIGRFEAAHQSTLFLDEIGDLPAEVQVKLLRVLQERVIERLGSVQPIKVDVRIVAATNRNLEQAVRDKTFREDLFYRLNVFPIVVPPLRERVEDIPALARHLLRRLATQVKKPVPEPTPDVLALLARYPFPGNVRELANELERALLLAEPGAPLTEDLLSERLQEASANGASPSLLQRRTDVFEREQIESAITRAGGVKSRAAEELGITYRGLLKKMKRLGM